VVAFFFARSADIKKPARRRAILFIIKVIGPTGQTGDAKRAVCCCCIRPRELSSSLTTLHRAPSLKLAQSLKKNQTLSSFSVKNFFPRRSLRIFSFYINLLS